MVNYGLGTRTRLAIDGGGLEAGPGGGGGCDGDGVSSLLWW